MPRGAGGEEQTMLQMTVLSGPDLGRGGRHGGGHGGGGWRHRGGGGGRYFVDRGYYPDYPYYQEPMCQVVVKNPTTGATVAQLIPCRLLSGR